MQPRRTRLLAGLLALVAGHACGPGEPSERSARLDLLTGLGSTGLGRLEVELPARETPAGARVVAIRSGLAAVRLGLRAEDGRVETSHEDERGRRFDFHRWDLPWMPAPELLASAERTELAGLDLPRMRGPADVEGLEDGLWYAGDDGAGAPCLRIALPAGAALPERFELAYPVLAADLAGTELARDVPVEELLRVPHAVGETTRRALVLPTGARLEWELPPAGGRHLATRLVADGSGLSVHPAPPGLGGPLEPGVPHTLVIDPAPETWTLEVRGGERLWIEQPVLERTRRPEDPPNVLFVLVDTLRYDRATEALMPALAGLAGESLSFAECWATCSWTLPSMTTLLTGVHGGQHQAWLNDRRLADGIATLPEVFADAGYATAAFTGGVFVDQSFGLDRGFGVFDSGGGGAEAVFGRARRWLEDAGSGPWFLLVHTYEVHSPYEPPAEAAERVLARHPGVLGDRPPEPQAFFDEDGAVDGDLGRIAALLADLYDEEVRYTDGVLGGFLDALRADGRYADAVVAVTSDHGEEFGEHGLFGHTDTLYREVLHVPFVLRLPGGARGGEVVERPVSQLDFAPTLLDAAGLLGSSPETFAGRSLLGDEPSPVYATRNIAEVGLLRAVRAEARTLIDGSYIYPREAATPELYDLARDPAQRRNVHGEDPRTAALEARFDELRARHDRPLVDAPVVDGARLEEELRNMGYVH